MAAEAEVATNQKKETKDMVHTDVMLFNRWSYDDVQVPFFLFFLF